MERKLRYILPSLISLVILLGLFCYEELYPLGFNSVVKVDSDYQFIPILYKIYDFLHGDFNIFYSDIGFGNNIFISMVIQGSIFSPLSLLLYLTDRDNIVLFYNIIVIVKICLISFTSYLYIDRTFKVSEYYKVIFSVLYSFSGWILLNYFNIMWMDSVILFPLIMMYLDKLLNEDKYYGYIITLGLSFIIGYYISYFILLFILFYSFIYIVLKIDKDKWKSVIYRLGISTGIALLISSFSLLPCLYQTVISDRFDYSNSSNIIGNMMDKSLFLVLSPVLVILFIKLIGKYKNDSKNIYFYIVLLVLFLIGLFVEPINLAIHMGGYWSLPYRYSFIVLFILMHGGLYYISKYNYGGSKDGDIARLILFILLFIFMIWYSFSIYDKIVNSLIMLDLKDIDVYIKMVIVSMMIILLMILALSFNNNRYRYISFGLVCLIEILIMSSWTLYYDKGYYLSNNSNELNNNLDFSYDGRYKSDYLYYTPNYGFIYDVDTLDNWLHIIPGNQIDVYEKLGYSVDGTRISSIGGTIFSDWLLNMRYLINNKYMNSEMFELKDKYNQYNLYEYKYNSYFGLLLDKDINKDYGDSRDFYLQNQIYRDIFDIDKDIIDIKNYEFDDIFVKEHEITYDIDSLGYLYMVVNGDISYIKVNDINIQIEVDNYNHIIDLGCYDKDVNIKIGVNNYSNLSFDLGFIKYDDINNINKDIDGVNNYSKNNDGYKINVLNDKGYKYLLLPINKIDGLKVLVNDKNIEIEKYLDNFVLIKLDNGENDIVVRYEMPLFKLGIVLSIIGIILLLIVRFIPSSKIVLNITYYVYFIVVICVFLYYYLLPFFKYYG